MKYILLTFLFCKGVRGSTGVVGGKSETGRCEGTEKSEDGDER